jgi:hypothetical protein
MLAHELNCVLLFVLPKCDIKNLYFLEFHLKVVCLIKIIHDVMMMKAAGSSESSALTVNHCEHFVL